MCFIHQGRETLYYFYRFYKHSKSRLCVLHSRYTHSPDKKNPTIQLTEVQKYGYGKKTFQNVKGLRTGFPLNISFNIKLVDDDFNELLNNIYHEKVVSSLKRWVVINSAVLLLSLVKKNPKLYECFLRNWDYSCVKPLLSFI